MAAIDRIGSSDAFLLARGGATLGPVQVYDDGVAVGISVPGEEWRGRAGLFRDANGNFFAHTAAGNYPLNTSQHDTAVAKIRGSIKAGYLSGLYDVGSNPKSNGGATGGLVDALGAIGVSPDEAQNAVATAAQNAAGVFGINTPLTQPTRGATPQDVRREIERQVLPAYGASSVYQLFGSSAYYGSSELANHLDQAARSLSGGRWTFANVLEGVKPGLGNQWAELRHVATRKAAARSDLDTQLRVLYRARDDFDHGRISRREFGNVLYNVEGNIQASGYASELTPKQSQAIVSAKAAYATTRPASQPIGTKTEHFEKVYQYGIETSGGLKEVYVGHVQDSAAPASVASQPAVRFGSLSGVGSTFLLPAGLQLGDRAAVVAWVKKWHAADLQKSPTIDGRALPGSQAAAQSQAASNEWWSEAGKALLRTLSPGGAYVVDAVPDFAQLLIKDPAGAAGLVFGGAMGGLMTIADGLIGVAQTAKTIGFDGTLLGLAGLVQIVNSFGALSAEGLRFIGQNDAAARLDKMGDNPISQWALAHSAQAQESLVSFSNFVAAHHREFGSALSRALDTEIATIKSLYDNGFKADAGFRFGHLVSGVVAAFVSPFAQAKGAKGVSLLEQLAKAKLADELSNLKNFKKLPVKDSFKLITAAGTAAAPVTLGTAVKELKSSLAEFDAGRLTRGELNDAITKANVAFKAARRAKTVTPAETLEYANLNVLAQAAADAGAKPVPVKKPAALPSSATAGALDTSTPIPPKPTPPKPTPTPPTPTPPTPATPTPATPTPPTPTPPTPTPPTPAADPGALVLANPAATAVDIPAPPGKGRDRVGAVYTHVSPDLATVLARTLQDVNPNTYGRQPTADIVLDVVRLGEGDSLIVVVRDKNIAGQSPMSDTVATPETLLSAKEYQQLLEAKGPDAFAQAGSRIRLGAAKIYNTPPESASAHIDAVKDVAGEGYGYLGQVIGNNLQGSGGQAMKLTLDLARAANMKGATLYTNAAAGFYEKLGFRTVAQTTNADGTVSNHMVWDNVAYRADQATLRLDNPSVLAALNKPAAAPDPVFTVPPVDRVPTAAEVGSASELPGVPFDRLKPSDLSFNVDGAVTRFELIKEATLGTIERKKQGIYDAGAMFWESKIEGPVIELGRSTRAKMQPSIDAAGLLVQEKILLPSARVLEEKVLAPVFESVPGQQLLSLIDTASQGFKSAAFDAKLRAIDFANSDAGLVLRDLATITRDAGLGAKDKVLNGLGKAGRQLQKSLPGVAGATLFVLGQAGARGTLRMVTVDVGAQPLVGEALMVKKALNIPNGIKFTYLIADVPGMENVGGRAIVAYGGGDHALILPATGSGQSGVAPPWFGRRADGSVVLTGTGIAQGPNAFFGYSLGTTNLNISDVYNAQLGRAATNPVSISASGEPRPSGRKWDFRLGAIALDLTSFGHNSVLNVGQTAVIFTRFRAPLSRKGDLVSSESKSLVLKPRVGADGKVTYVPFIDITAKASVSDISPVFPLTGSTTWDPKAKDWNEAQNLFKQLDGFVRGLPDAPAPTLPAEPFAPLVPKRSSDGSGPNSATNGDPPAGGSGGGGDVPPPNRPPGDLLDQAGVPQTLTPEQREVARRNNLQMSLKSPSSPGAEPPLQQTRVEDLPRDRGFDPDTIVGMRAGDFAKEYLKIYNGFEANGTSHAADPALAARVYEVWKPEEALRLREIGARHDTPFEALVPFRVAAFDFARIEQLAQSGLVANNALRATEQGLERQMMSAGAYTVFNNVALPGAEGALAALSAALPRDAGGTLAARSTFGPGAGNTPAPDAVLGATAAALRQRFPRLYGSSSDAQIIERAQLRNNQITVSVNADNEVRFAVGTPRNVSVIPPGGGGLATAQYEQSLNEFAAALKRGNVTYRDNSIAEIVQGAELRSKTLFVLRDSTNPQAIATMTASLKEYGAITGLEGESFKQGTYAYLGQLTAGSGANAVPGAGTEQMSALQNVVRNSLARADVPDLQGIVLYTNNPANIKTYLDAGFSLTAVHQSAQSGKYEYYFRWAPGANTDLQEVPMVWVQSDHGGSEPPPTVGVPLRSTEPAPVATELPVQTSTQGRTEAVLDFLDMNLPGHAQPARRAAQATLWNTADAVAVVVDADGQVVAAARGSLRDDSLGRIDVVAVDVAARRQGLGRRVIESVEQQLRSQGAQRIELRAADNTAAQREELLAFYRGLGYAESAEHPGYLEKNLTSGAEPLSPPPAGETTLEENISAASGAAGAGYKTLSLFKDPASGLPNRLGQEFLMSFVDPATGQRRQMTESDLALPEARAALAEWGISEPRVLDDGRVMTVDMKRLKELLANTAIAPNDAKNVRVTTELARPKRAGPQYTLGELWLATGWTQREFAVSHVPGSAQWSVLMGTGRLENGTWRTAIPPKDELILHFHPNGSPPSKTDILAAQSGGIGGRNSLVITAAPGQKIDDVTVYVFGDVPGNRSHPGTRVKTPLAPGAEVRSEPADGGGVPTDPALQARIARQATLLNPAGEPLAALPSGYQPGLRFALALEESAGLPSRVWVAEQPSGTDAQSFKSLVSAAASVPRATAQRSLLLVNAELDSNGQVQATRRDGASISHAQAQAIADATQRPVLTEAIVAAVMPRSWIAKVDATGYAPSDIRGARQSWSETVLRRLVKKFGAEATPRILDAVAQRNRFPNDSLTTARVDQFMQVMLPAANSHAQTQALDQLTANAGLARGQPETDLLRSYLLNVGTLRWAEERWVQAMWMLTGENFSSIQTRLFNKLDQRLGLKSYDDVMRYYGRLVLDAVTR